MAAILDFTHNAIHRVLAGLTTMSDNPIVGNNNQKSNLVLSNMILIISSVRPWENGGHVGFSPQSNVWGGLLASLLYRAGRGP